METYTPEVLTYISELEDRIDMLEALCEDYAEHIKDVEYKLDGSKRALDRFFELTKLVSENHKVADLVGAQIGDDIIDKIYDYLLSQAETTQQAFKPISEMTIEDWQQALNEGWLFKTEDRGNSVVVELEPNDCNYEVRMMNNDYGTWWISLSGIDHDREGWTITKRIK